MTTMRHLLSIISLSLLLTILSLHTSPTEAYLPSCKVYLDNDKSQFVDLNVLAREDYYGPVALNSTKKLDWHYYINICAPVKKECWVSEDYFASSANDKWIMHDDYSAIQVQNSKLEDKDHIDCNYIGARYKDDNEVYFSAKATNVKDLHFSVVYENGEPLTWYGEEYNRRTVINVRCNRNLKEGQTIVKDIVGESSSPPGVYSFEVESRDICEVQTEGGLPPLFPIGILGLLLLLVLVVFALYWIIGAIVNKFVFKKEGIEIVPNVHFWRRLPSLVVDGVTWPLALCGISRTAVSRGDDVDAEADIFDEA